MTAVAGPEQAGAGTPAQAPERVDVVRTQPALRLGHYSSEDGRVGFVLDQTSAAPLLRFDARSEVVPLQYRDAGDRTTYLSPEDGSFSIQQGRWGGLRYVGPGYYPHGVDIYRDADAEPLARQ